MTNLITVLIIAEKNLLLFWNFGVILIAIIVFSLLIRRNIKSHGLFAAFAKKHNLAIADSKGSIFHPPLPSIEGKIDGYALDFFVKREKGKWRGRWKYFTIIRVHARHKNQLSFNVKQTGITERIFSEVIDLDVKTGFADFDHLYKLKSNNETTILRIFDEGLCSDFTSNPEAFASSGLDFQSGCLVFKENSVAQSSEQMDRYSEILLFMVHLTERIDTDGQRN